MTQNYFMQRNMNTENMQGSMDRYVETMNYHGEEIHVRDLNVTHPHSINEFSVNKIVLKDEEVYVDVDGVLYSFDILTYDDRLKVYEYVVNVHVKCDECGALNANWVKYCALCDTNLLDNSDE